jgi:peptidoglycan/xylan/chitin deacetylase (PgdA/CDA1 family)
VIYRNDDIFLTESPRGFGEYYSFEKFKKSHELLKGHKHILAIIAGEIENYPEMKEYILKHKDDFMFGIHGWAHERYSEWKEPAIYISIKRAKEKIESTFGVKATHFCPTWNKRNYDMYIAVQKLGMEVQDHFIVPREIEEGKSAEAVCFHYWNDDEMTILQRCIPQTSDNSEKSA